MTVGEQQTVGRLVLGCIVSKFSYRAPGQINSLPNRIIAPEGYINAINMFRDVQ